MPIPQELNTPLVSNLPPPPGPLIGRAREQARLGALLRTPAGRLVTLTGAGGMGKTSLILQVAADLRAHFPDGVCFVALAAVRHPALVMPTIAATLGIQEVRHQPLLRSVATALQDQQVLLILDNFEQVTAGASWITLLLGLLPRLKVVVTSRERLALDAEQEFVVPALAVPDPGQLPALPALAAVPAVALFVERARAVQPDFRLTAENALPIVQICRRLDGLPLAIELAAAHTRGLPPEGLLRRLSAAKGTSPLYLLSDPTSHLPARQRTLRSTIDWSFELLAPGQRQLFARLGVFPGDWSLDAAVTICDTTGTLGPEIAEGIHALVSKSLLRQVDDAQGQPRFGMLETIHEYAIERLARSQEEETLRRRHAAYYLALAEAGAGELQGARQGEWLQRLDEDHDNLRATLRWSLAAGEGAIALRLGAALWRFWSARGYLSEGRGWLNAICADAEDSQDSVAIPHSAAHKGNPAGFRTPHLERVQAEVLYGAGTLAWLQNDYAQAVARLDGALVRWRAVGAQEQIAGALCRLGAIAHSQGQLTGAAALYEQGLAMFRARGDRRGIANALNNLGVIVDAQGEYARAIRLHQESLALRRALSDQRGIAGSLSNLGVVALHQGNYAPARMLCEEALALFAELDDKRGMAAVLTNLARTTLRAGDAPGARVLHRQSLTRFHNLGDKEGIAECLEGLAEVAAQTGQAERTAQLLGAAAALRTTIGVPLTPTEEAGAARIRAATRQQLGDAAWHQAQATGQAMTLDAVISYAQEDEGHG
ncbi:MAG TPA: tetratricopeptide repeat protein [Chloroflexia bacterium]|nr:tetratricopeptide repeat protein [Chloroflexia bacterium]